MLKQTVMRPRFVVLTCLVVAAIFVGLSVLEGYEKERNDSDIKRTTGGEKTKLSEIEDDSHAASADISQPSRHVLHRIITDDDEETTNKESSYFTNLQPIQGKDVVIVYNRVGKCGSRTFLSLAETMARKNGFKKPRDIINPAKQGPPTEKDVIAAIKRAHPPALLYGHVLYADLDNESDYVYMNIIRDPLDRLVSFYYFSINGDDKFENHLSDLHKRLKPKYLNETFDQCVLRNRSTCTGSSVASKQLQYFCGFDERCKKPSRWALERAKKNMDNYLLVGLTEQYEDNLRLLEYLLPQYFTGIVAEYQKPSVSKTASQTKSHNKQPPSARVKEIMQERLKYEYELYDFARERFHRFLRGIFQD